MSWFKKLLAWLTKAVKKVNDVTNTTTTGKSATVTEKATATTEEKVSTKAANDDIDPATVTWDESSAGDVGAWKLSETITSAEMSAKKISVTLNPANDWKQLQKEGWDKPAVGNWWIIAFVKGAWHGATTEWLGVGATSCNKPKFDGTDDIHGVIGTDWRPIKGETAYIMRSSFARSGVLTSKDRSNIVKISIP